MKYLSYIKRLNIWSTALWCVALCIYFYLPNTFTGLWVTLAISAVFISAWVGIIIYASKEYIGHELTQLKIKSAKQSDKIDEMIYTQLELSEKVFQSGINPHYYTIKIYTKGCTDNIRTKLNDMDADEFNAAFLQFLKDYTNERPNI